MEGRRGRWTALRARVPAGMRLDQAGLRQVGLYRGAAARMRTRGLRSWQAYLHVLEASPSEFAALTNRLQATLYRGAEPPSFTGRVREAQLRQWIDSCPLPALAAERIGPGHAIRLLACNGPACELLGAAGRGRQSVTGAQQWLLPDRSPCRDEDMPLYQALWQRSVTRGRPFLLRGDNGVLHAVLVDARPIPGRRRWALETIRAAAPWDAGAAGDGARTRLPQAAAHYQQLFEEAATAIVLTSSSGAILEANGRARELMRVHVQDLVGSSFPGLLAEESLPAFHKALVSLARSGKGEARLSFLARPDLVFEAQAREVRGGEAPLVQWVLHDVSAQVRADRLHRDLVDLLLHDLRSPLATSALGVEAAERAFDRDDPPRARRSLSMASAAMRRLSHLVDSLLDVSRLEAGQPILRPTEVRPGEILSAAAAEVEPALAAQNLQLQLELSPSLPTVVADGDMLFRAVINLLDNAIKFSPANAQISLKADAQDRGLLIRVRDEGPGIPRELQPRIFDKFIGQYLPHAPRGYGLGLAFCKLAIEAHGGWVAVDSSPGEGSTFALWLPARPDFPDVA